MSEDDQLLYDEFKNLRELEARAIRDAANLEASAHEQRALAADYGARAMAIARQLGFTG